MFSIGRNNRPGCPGTLLSILMICLLSVFMTAAAGCASAPVYRTHAELPQRASAIKTVGLLLPMISMYEEQFKFGLNTVVPHDDWAHDATEAVRKAFLDETAAVRMPVKVIDEENQELNDMLDLYSAVDFSIQKHAYKSELGVIVTKTHYDVFPREPFREEVLSLDYSLGPVRTIMERHQVDAVWIVTGFNLLPTTGAQLGDAGAVLLEILSAGKVGAAVLLKLEFRAALVDKSGTILFYCVLNEENLPQVAQKSGQFNISQGADTSQAAEERPATKDIRDPKTARSYVRALLAEFRKVVAQ